VVADFALSGPDATCLPARLALTRGENAPVEPLTVEDLGRKGASTYAVLASRALVSFRAGQVVLLRMPLLRACLGFRRCGDDESCGPGDTGTVACQPAARA